MTDFMNRAFQDDCSKSGNETNYTSENDQETSVTYVLETPDEYPSNDILITRGGHLTAKVRLLLLLLTRFGQRVEV